MGNYKITAEGIIIAQGTANDTIRFYGNGGLNWGGLRLEDETNENYFDYCRISNTDDTNNYGIHSINSPVYIDHSYIDDHQKAISFSALSSNNPSSMEIRNSKIANVQKSGITIVDNSNVLIDNCEVTQCGLGASFYGAIQLSLQNNSHSCSPTITNNFIHHNDKQGITLANLYGYDNMAPTVEYNEVSYNYTGIYLYVGKGTYKWNHIHHNFEENNADSGAGVMLYGNGADATFTYNEIHDNYTGFYLTTGATANLGDLNNTITDDDGYNCIYDNIFYTGEEYSVYNASASNVIAENTVWDDDPPIDVTIIDGNDNAAYGIVDYEPTLSPFAPPDSIFMYAGFIFQVFGPAYPTYKNLSSLQQINAYLDGILIGTFQLGDLIQLEGLIIGQEYTFGASLIYEDGGSDILELEFIYTPTILNPPQNPGVEIDFPNAIFSWDNPEPGSTSPPSSLGFFNVYLDGTLQGTTNDNEWIFTNLVFGINYLAEVTANYEAGESEPAGVEFTLTGIDHDPPLNSGYEVFPDHIHLYWEEPSSYVEEYHIYVDGVMYITTELYFDIYDLIPGQEYEIGLTALYIDGIESDPITFNILFVDSEDILNLETKLLGNHPNPFNPSTTISFTLASEDLADVELEIYNLKGQRIKTFPVILSGVEGQSSIIWDGTDQTEKPVSSAVYFYKLVAGDKIFFRKMLLLK